MRASTRRGRLGLAVASALIVIFALGPIYWMIATSFKTTANITSVPTQWFPWPITFSNYVDAFRDYPFATYILNSLVVAVSSTVLVLAFGLFAGYALARAPMKGRLPILMALLMVSVFPSIAVIAPLYLLMRDIGWLNSYQALILPYTAFNLPFAIWILRNFLIDVPVELEESARIDGASPLRIVVSVLVPVSLPGIFTAGVFCFTACWTEFLMALSFNSSDSFRTIPVGVALFGTPHTTPFGVLFAASTVAVVPIAILVLVFRRAVVSGLTGGAVKG
jgi:multiple sugar transport system permease protein